MGAAEAGSWGGGGGTGGISTGGLGGCAGPSRAEVGGPGVVAVFWGGLAGLDGTGAGTEVPAARGIEEVKGKGEKR